MKRFAKTYNAEGVEIVTREEWARARRHGYAQIWDGRRWMLRLDPETGATVYRIVEVR